MATDNPQFLSGWRASGDLSSYQYYIVKAYETTANQVAVCSGATDVPVGVLYDKPDTAGDGCNVAGFAAGSTIKAKVGATGVTAGYVGTDASGLLVTKSAENDLAFGRVDQSYSSGEIAEVLCLGLMSLPA